MTRRQLSAQPVRKGRRRLTGGVAPLPTRIVAGQIWPGSVRASLERGWCLNIRSDITCQPLTGDQAGCALLPSRSSHRQRRRLFPAHARHDAGNAERRDRSPRLGRGAAGAYRQAGRWSAEHPRRDALHGGAQHLVRERARLDAGDSGRGRGPARHPAAALSRAERHRHLRRHERPPDSRAGTLLPPAEHGVRPSDGLPRTDCAD